MCGRRTIRLLSYERQIEFTYVQGGTVDSEVAVHRVLLGDNVYSAVRCSVGVSAVETDIFLSEPLCIGYGC